MEEELWMPWPQNKKYSISSKGRIKGLNGRIMKLRNHRGYYYICLRPEKNKQGTYQVHRIVAETFLSDYNETLYVDHINGIRTDNRVENLRMVEPITNTLYKNQNRQNINEIINELIIHKGYEETEKLLLKLKEDNL